MSNLSWNRFKAYLVHKTVYGEKSELELFGLEEELEVIPDGIVILLDRRVGGMRAFRYYMHNRYFTFMGPGARVRDVWQYLLNMGDMSPLAIIENNEAFTPYCRYRKVPERYQRLLAT